MDKILLKFSNAIIANINNTTDIGLFNGKMGIAIFLYEYSKYTHNKLYEEMADNLLDQIFSQSENLALTSVSNGYAGIGVGLMYLMEKGFVIGNANDVLHEIDNRLLGNFTYTVINDSVARDKLLSACLYFAHRVNYPLSDSCINNLKKEISNIIYLFLLNYKSFKSTSELIMMINSVLYIEKKIDLSENKYINMHKNQLINYICNKMQMPNSDAGMMFLSLYTFSLLSNGEYINLQSKDLYINKVIDSEFINYDLIKCLWMDFIFEIKKYYHVYDTVVSKFIYETDNNINYYLDIINSGLSILGIRMLNGLK